MELEAKGVNVNGVCGLSPISSNSLLNNGFQRDFDTPSISRVQFRPTLFLLSPLSDPRLSGKLDFVGAFP